jgi:hypothetical protein
LVCVGPGGFESLALRDHRRREPFAAAVEAKQEDGAFDEEVGEGHAEIETEVP